jgi:hypothetical protein
VGANGIGTLSAKIGNHYKSQRPIRLHSNHILENVCTFILGPISYVPWQMASYFFFFRIKISREFGYFFPLDIVGCLADLET